MAKKNTPAFPLCELRHPAPGIVPFSFSSAFFVADTPPETNGGTELKGPSRWAVMICTKKEKRERGKHGG
jgi:hypothetical protein